MDLRIEIEGEGELVIPQEIQEAPGIQIQHEKFIIPLAMLGGYAGTIFVPMLSDIVRKWGNEKLWPFLKSLHLHKTKVNGQVVNPETDSLDDIINKLQGMGGVHPNTVTTKGE